VTPRAAGLALVLALSAIAAPAAAFPTGEQFDLDPLTEDGGGGLAFTGAPRHAGHTCAVCHTGAPGRIGLQLLGDPAELFSSGYRPGTEYHLRVVITGEWAAADRRSAGDSCGEATEPFSRCDDNGFSLETTDIDGDPVGRFAPVVDGVCDPNSTLSDVRVLADKTAITHSGAHHGRNAWDLCWTAPGAGTGPVTAYLSAVDGNGGKGTFEDPNTVDGDDVASGAVPFAEHGGDPAGGQVGGCAAGGDTGLGAALIVLALVLAHRRRAGRRAVFVLAVAALALSATGCATVHAHEKEYLAKRKMVFAPDPTEDELDLHMQQSREGSAGGYGSAGGGCGCN